MQNMNFLKMMNYSMHYFRPKSAHLVYWLHLIWTYFFSSFHRNFTRTQIRLHTSICSRFKCCHFFMEVVWIFFCFFMHSDSCSLQSKSEHTRFISRSLLWLRFITQNDPVKKRTCFRVCSSCFLWYLKILSMSLRFPLKKIFDFF